MNEIKPWRAFLLVRKVAHISYNYTAWRQDGKLVGLTACWQESPDSRRPGD